MCFIKFGSNSVVLNAKPGYAKNGLLKSITYPTGGSLRYEYAQNEGLIGNQNTIVGGVHVSQTSVIDGGYSNNCDNPIITNYNYRSEASGTVSSLWGMEMPVNFVETKTFYEPEDKYVGFVSLVTLGCNYRYKYPGIQSREQGFSLTARQQFFVALSTALDIISGALVVVDVIVLAMSATPAAIAAVIIDAIAIAITFAITCFSNNEVDETIHIYYNSDVKWV